MCIDSQLFKRGDNKTEAVRGVGKKKRTSKVVHGMIRRLQRQSIVRKKWLNCRFKETRMVRLKQCLINSQ